MPRRRHRKHKPAATPPPQIKSEASSPASGSTSFNFRDLKRSELQKCCKELGLSAGGKNAELIERLDAYHGKSELETLVAVGGGAAEKTKEPAEKVTSEAPEEEKDVVEGWCVVHGMVLYRPSSSWAPLILRRGSVCVVDGEDLVPFNLYPLDLPVPDGLSDNHICRECVLRNRETPKRLYYQMFSSQDLRDSTSHPSAVSSCSSKDRRRAAQSKKIYQPQEDQEYAQRVEGILTQIAHGKVGIDEVLNPVKPLVVHSPGPSKQ